MTSGAPGLTSMPGPINAASMEPHHPLKTSLFAGLEDSLGRTIMFAPSDERTRHEAQITIGKVVHAFSPVSNDVEDEIMTRGRRPRTEMRLPT
jgi:hypothetical protein